LLKAPNYEINYLFILANSVYAQEWIQEPLDKIGFGSADSLLAYFHSEMKNQIGKEPPMLSFQPLEEPEAKYLKSFKGNFKRLDVHFRQRLFVDGRQSVISIGLAQGPTVIHDVPFIFFRDYN
jgi:hypothetical protein